jgi:hypothetical protein
MKKDEARFTIRFNAADPRQQKAMNTLKAAGRRKASLISDAVNEYLIRHGYDAAAPIPPPAPAIATSSEPSIPHASNDADDEIGFTGHAFKSHSAAAQGEDAHIEVGHQTPDDDICSAILDGLSAFKM